jgi:hypothetical protein
MLADQTPKLRARSSSFRKPSREPPISPFSGWDSTCPHRTLRRKYQYMEMNLQQRKKGLLSKIPDIEKTLAMVMFLRDRRVSCRSWAPLPDPNNRLIERFVPSLVNPKPLPVKRTRMTPETVSMTMTAQRTDIMRPSRRYSS